MSHDQNYVINNEKRILALWVAKLDKKSQLGQKIVSKFYLKCEKLEPQFEINIITKAQTQIKIWILLKHIKLKLRIRAIVIFSLI